jgi:hypothetical protein
MTEFGRRRTGPLGPILLAAAAFALAGAPARATPFEATLSLQVDSAIGSLGSASFVATGSGSSTHSLISLPSGIFAGAARLPVAGVASLSAISLEVSGNRAGKLSTSFGFFLRGRFPISGALRLQGNLGSGPQTLVSVPLHVTAHVQGSAAVSRGLGIGGGYLAPDLYVGFDNWATIQEESLIPWGMYTYATHLYAGMNASALAFYNGTTFRESDARTPAGLGQVTLVSPIRIETSLPGTGSLLLALGTLHLVFVPEPGTLLLLGGGTAALGLLGRSRLRRSR